MFTEPSRTIEIPTGDAYPVRGDVYLPAASPALGIVLLCHGFKGYKTWGFLPYLASRLRDAGLVAISLDMALNGTFPTPQGATASRASGNRVCDDEATRYVRPDLFEKNTLMREFKDVGCAIRLVSEGGLGSLSREPLPLGLFGHSRGCVAATLNAIEEPAVSVLCTWSAIDDPDLFTSEQKEKWRRQGKYYFVDAAEGTQLAVGLNYLDDLEENHDFYLLRERVRELRVPHLIVHGKLDLVVKVDCAIRIHEAERQVVKKRLCILHTGHTFGLPYPMPHQLKKVPQALVRAADETVLWFRKHFHEQGAR